MSLSAAFGTVIIGGIQLINTSKKQEEYDRRLKKAMKYTEKLLEPMIRKTEMRNYITNFIDEIPELSYYEAAQLKKKLGNIYVEWNDE